MEAIAALIPLFITIIALCAVLTALGFIFNVLLTPVKKDIMRLEQNQFAIEKKIDDLKDLIIQKIVNK